MGLVSWIHNCIGQKPPDTEEILINKPVNWYHVSLDKMLPAKVNDLSFR